MPEPAIMAERSQRLAELESMYGRKADLECRQVALRRELSELESEIKIAERAINALLGLLYGSSTSSEGRASSQAPPTPTLPSSPTPATPPTTAAPVVAIAPAVVAQRSPGPPPTDTDPRQVREETESPARGLPDSPVVDEMAADPTRTSAEGTGPVTPPSSGPAVPVNPQDLSDAVVKDAFSTPTQQRRARAYAIVSAALARLGGSASLDELLLEYRKEDPGCARRKLESLLERKGNFFGRGADGRWRAVQGGEVRTERELRTVGRRLLVAQAIRDLGGTARWAEILDLLQRRHGDRFDSGVLNRDLRAGGFEQVARGHWRVVGEDLDRPPPDVSASSFPNRAKRLKMLDEILADLGGEARTADIIRALRQRIDLPMSDTDIVRLLRAGGFRHIAKGHWGSRPADGAAAPEPEQPVVFMPVDGRVTRRQQARLEAINEISSIIASRGGSARRRVILDDLRAKDPSWNDVRLSAFLGRTPALRLGRNKEWWVVPDANLATEGEQRSMGARTLKWQAITDALEVLGGSATLGQVWRAVKRLPGGEAIRKERDLQYLLRVGPFVMDLDRRWSPRRDEPAGAPAGQRADAATYSTEELGER